MSSTGPDSDTPSATKRRNWADLGPRFISAFVLMALTASGLYLGGYFFASVVGVAYAGAYREWEMMVTRAPLGVINWVLIGLVGVSALAFPLFGGFGTLVFIALACILGWFVSAEDRTWRLTGLALFGLLIFAAVSLRGTSEAGIWAGVYLGVVVWMTDSAAFFTGRQIGGEKLAPEISPSKTWSGALGGLALGAGAGTLFWIFVTGSPWWIGLMLSLMISVLGQLGDLSESAIKRHFRIKDSGDIIPGHGGLMDRLDSLTFGLILVLIIGSVHGGLDAVAQGLLYW